MNSCQTCVVDANIAVWMVVPDPYGWGKERMRRIMQGEVIVPGLWVYEVTSVLYRYARAQADGEAWLQQTLPPLLALADEVVHPDPELALAAAVWAKRLGRAKAYDAFYLALAERLGCDFWTGDKRLYNNARQIGADFVKMLGESEA